jgi:hypothetical protein
MEQGCDKKNPKLVLNKLKIMEIYTQFIVIKHLVQGSFSKNL